MRILQKRHEAGVLEQAVEVTDQDPGVKQALEEDPGALEGVNWVPAEDLEVHQFQGSFKSSLQMLFLCS